MSAMETALAYEDGYDQGHADAHADGAAEDRLCVMRKRAEQAEAEVAAQRALVAQARTWIANCVDPARCRFTYRRFTLVGECEVPPGPYAWSRPRETHDAIGTVLTTAQWTVAMLYRVNPTVHEAPLVNLTLSVRALR